MTSLLGFDSLLEGFIEPREIHVLVCLFVYFLGFFYFKNFIKV